MEADTRRRPITHARLSAGRAGLLRIQPDAIQHQASTTRRRIAAAAAAARDLDTGPSDANRENQHATADRIKLNRLIRINLPRYFIFGFQSPAPPPARVKVFTRCGRQNSSTGAAALFSERIQIHNYLFSLVQLDTVSNCIHLHHLQLYRMAKKASHGLGNLLCCLVT